MTFTSLLKITESPLISTVIWILLLLAALYFARKPFQRAVMSFSKIIRNAMRFASASVLIAEGKLSLRNREVLMAAGLENAERMVEREFDRINTAVERDLELYPNIHRQLAELVTRLDEDYSESTDVPPSLPDWIPMIESIAKIKHSGDSMVSKMLAEINRTLTEQHKSAIEIYRTSISSRHSILGKMLPRWRKIQRLLTELGKSVTNLNDRAKITDGYMGNYEEIRAQTDSSVRKLSSSSLTQFFIAGIVLLIAFGGALINFNLIALPMSEMVGGASYIGPYKTSDVAGLVIILVELTMGLFLMESLRITRLFPVISSMDDKMRYRMILITFTLLTVLAGVESALAFMRDRIAFDIETLRQTLAGVEQTTLSASMIPTVGQMVMGFILPFALAFVAIPLESFVASSRTVLGITGVGLLRITAFLLRLLGSMSYYFARFILNVYDLLIFPTIWLEEVITGVWYKAKASPEQEEDGKEKTESSKNRNQALE
jgi:tetratricopeptide (TPR) repeat protein